MIIDEILINFVYLLNFLFFSFLSIFLFEGLFKIRSSKGENLLKASLIFSLALSVSPLYTGESYGLLEDTILIWIYSFIALILLILGHITMDKLIFGNVKNIEEIRSGNIALAIAEGSNFIATSLVVRSVIDNMFSIKINHLEFWIKLISIYLSIQILLALSLFIYNEYLKKVKKLDIKALIYQGNISASIHISANYIIISFLLATAFVVGKTTLETLILTTVYFLLSLILIEIIRFLVDITLFRREKLSTLIKNDEYFKILYIDTFVIAVIFIYHFLES